MSHPRMENPETQPLVLRIQLLTAEPIYPLVRRCVKDNSAQKKLTPFLMKLSCSCLIFITGGVK